LFLTYVGVVFLCLATQSFSPNFKSDFNTGFGGVVTEAQNAQVVTQVLWQQDAFERIVEGVEIGKTPFDMCVLKTISEELRVGDFYDKNRILKFRAFYGKGGLAYTDWTKEGVWMKVFNKFGKDWRCKCRKKM
jgi:hypothetical protein